ncbi:MAG: hypothetical protein NT069_19540 [Planctomycetota bacterium]|nr:hypothetical protein [Planctomycetota bacterium]
MKSLTRIVLEAFAVGVFLIAGSTQAGVLNGSFEDPSLGAGPTFTTYSAGQTIGSGWVVDGASNIVDVLTSN